MHNFLNLVGFELKKIFVRKSVIISILLALALIVLSSVAMVLDMNPTSNHSGELSNYEEMLLDKSYGLDLTGRYLDGDLILEASEAYSKISLDIHPYSEGEAYQDFARPYSSVYTMIDAAYQRRGSTFDIEDFQHISQDMADDFYDIRYNQYRENLMNNPMFTEKNVDVVMALDEDVKKPIRLQYSGGYERFFSLTTSNAMIIMMLIAFIISPMFSEEYQKKTDQLILTSKHKETLIKAKIFTGLSVSIIVTLICMVLAYLTCMMVYGFDGGDASLQNYIVLLTYDFTMLEMVGIMFITSLFGGFLMTGISMFFSSHMKRPIVSLSLSTLVVMMGMFNGINAIWYAKLRLFTPVAMGTFFEMIANQLSWHVLGVDIMLYQAVCITAVLVSSLLFILTYRRFKLHQIT